MKYQNIQSFEKHLESASPSHLCRVYLVIIPDDSSRFLALQRVAKALQQGGSKLEKFSPEADLYQIFDALQSPSLFGEETVVMMDECETLKKGEVDQMLALLGGLFVSGSLILGSRGKTPLAKGVEKVGVILDLSEEKPWDKDKRLLRFLEETASRDQKHLSSNAAELLLQRVGKDLLLLSSELAKLVCYVGDRPSILPEDILQISALNDEETPWKMAEEMVWEGQRGVYSAAELQPLLFGLRSQLQMGMKICSLTQEGVPFGEWSPHFPKVWPRTLEKRREQALQKGEKFFQKGLDTLFQAELLSRSGSVHLEALFDLLNLRLVSF